MLLRVFVTGCLFAVVFGQDWGYDVNDGPSVWPDWFPECYGTTQSPVTLPNVWENHQFLRKLDFHEYELKRLLSLYNDGHTLHIEYKSDGNPNPYVTGSLFPPGVEYELAGVHLHWGSKSTWGSEHIMEGKQYPGEIHFVHWNKKYKTIEAAKAAPGGILVAGFFIGLQDTENRNWDPLFQKLYKVNGTTTPVPMGKYDLMWLLPEESKTRDEFYFYEGSFTTPPCSEVVMWHVFRDPVYLSERQLDYLRTLMSADKKNMSDNMRFSQALNKRKVFQHREVSASSKDNVLKPEAKGKGKIPLLHLEDYSGLEDLSENSYYNAATEDMEEIEDYQSNSVRYTGKYLA